MSWIVVRDTNPDDLLDILTEFIGTPIRVFRAHPMWKPITIDLDRPPGRSGGIGFNSLHQDFVNCQSPPDYACFYCVRPDPNGGGQNIVADLTGIEDEVSDPAPLYARVYADGQSCNLDWVGPDISPFPIVSETGWRYRWTGRLLDSYPELYEAAEVLAHRQRVIDLDAGDALIVDQRRVVHGRLPLAGDQRLLTERRELLSCYVRR